MAGLTKAKIGMEVMTPEGYVGKIVRVYASLVTVEVIRGNSTKQILINPSRLSRFVPMVAKKKKK